MLTDQTQYSLGNARSYFAEHLAVGDYYAEGQTVAGLWFGRGCERLRLAGRVGESEFHPSGSEQRLDLMFATHEVQIQGYALRRLVVAMQRRANWPSSRPFLPQPNPSSPTVKPLFGRSRSAR